MKFSPIDFKSFVLPNGTIKSGFWQNYDFALEEHKDFFNLKLFVSLQSAL